MLVVEVDDRMVGIAKSAGSWCAKEPIHNRVKTVRRTLHNRTMCAQSQPNAILSLLSFINKLSEQTACGIINTLLKAQITNKPAVSPHMCAPFIWHWHSLHNNNQQQYHW